MVNSKSSGSNLKKDKKALSRASEKKKPTNSSGGLAIKEQSNAVYDQLDASARERFETYYRVSKHNGVTLTDGFQLRMLRALFVLQKERDATEMQKVEAILDHLNRKAKGDYPPPNRKIEKPLPVVPGKAKMSKTKPLPPVPEIKVKLNHVKLDESDSVSLKPTMPYPQDNGSDSSDDEEIKAPHLPRRKAPSPPSRSISSSDSSSSREVVRKDKYWDFANVCAGYKPRITKGDLEAQNYLRAKKIPFQEVTAGTTVNPHSVAAAIRELATVKAFQSLYERGVRTVVSLFGSGRDIKILNYLNLKVDPKLRMKLVIHRPIVLPQDISRNIKDADVVVLDDWDLTAQNTYLGADVGFLIVNVYAWASLIGQKVIESKFTADVLFKAVMQNSQHAHPVVWIGHEFNGVAGTVENASAWLRNDNNLIIHKSDVESTAYPAHDDCAWIHSDGLYVSPSNPWHMTWCNLRTISDTTLVIFDFTKITPIVPARVKRLAQWDLVEVSSLPLWLEDLRDLSSMHIPECLAWFQKRTFKGVVYNPLFAEASEYLAGRTVNTYSMKLLVQHLKTLAERDPNWILFNRLFPRCVHGVIENTALMITNKHTRDYKITLSWINGAIGSRITAASAELNVLGEAQPDAQSATRTVLLTSGCFLATFMVYKGTRYVFNRPGVLKAGLSSGSLGSALCDVASESWSLLKRGFNSLISAARFIVSPSHAQKMCQELVNDAKEIGALLNPPEGSPPVTYMQALEATSKNEILFMAQIVAEELWKKKCVWRGIPLGLMGLMSTEFLNTCSRVVKGAPQTNVYDTIVIAGVLYLPAAVMHVASYTLPFAKGVALHWVFNKCVLSLNRWLIPVSAGMLSACVMTDRIVPTQPAKRVTDFVSEFHSTPWPRAPCDFSNKAITLYLPEQGIITKQSRSFYKPKPLDEVFLKVTGSIDNSNTLEMPLETRQKTFNYLLHNVPMYYPGRTMDNLSAVVTARLLVQPPLDPVSQDKMWRGFRITLNSQIDHNHVCMFWPDTVQRWLDNITDGMKRNRARMALQMIKSEGWTASRAAYEAPKWARNITIMVKTDEALLKFDDDFHPQMKPRSIAVVDTKVQVLIGPYIMAATERLMVHWPLLNITSGDVYQIGLWRIRVQYGGKATNLSLSYWMQEALRLSHAEVLILVAGDDSLIAMNVAGTVYFVEGDFAMCDISISTGPLHFQYNVFKQLGVPKSACHLLELLAHAKYRVGGLTIKRQERPFRDTGGADTSIGNAIVGAGALVYVFAHLTMDVPKTDDFVEIMNSLGFEMKVKIFQDPLEPTFLKGLWFSSGKHGYVWAPLPSRVLKMGKSHNHPCSLYPRQPYPIACMNFGRALALSYKDFGNVPLLGDLVNAMLAWPVASDVKPLSLDHWKVSSSPGFETDINYPLAVLQMSRRYQMESTSILELAAILHEVRPFVFLEHPVFLALALRDYA